jgi:hypothetical protein
VLKQRRKRSGPPSPAYADREEALGYGDHLSRVAGVSGSLFVLHKTATPERGRDTGSAAQLSVPPRGPRGGRRAAEASQTTEGGRA